MTQEQTLKNLWKIILVIICFIFQFVISISALIGWIGYMDLFQIALLILVVFIYFSGIQFMTYTIKKSANQLDDLVIDAIVYLFVYFSCFSILLLFPFNAITVVIFALVNFGCIFSLAFFSSKFLSKKDDINIKLILFFVTFTITFIFAFISVDFVYLILLYAIGILQLFLFNKKYNVWNKLGGSKGPMYIMIGSLILLFIFLVFFIILYSY